MQSEERHTGSKKAWKEERRIPKQHCGQYGILLRADAGSLGKRKKRTLPRKKAQWVHSPRKGKCHLEYTREIKREDPIQQCCLHRAMGMPGLVLGSLGSRKEGHFVTSLFSQIKVAIMASL